METKTHISTIPLLFFLLAHFCCCFYNAIGSSSALSTSATQINGRSALEIIIGGGGSTPPAYPPDNGEWAGSPQPPPPACPPPPPPPCPPPPMNPPSPRPPLNELLQSIKVIQRFGKKICDDPMHIRDTWVGNDICVNTSSYVGFTCYKGKSTKNQFRVVGVNFNPYKLNVRGGCPALPIQGLLDELKDIVFFHANSNGFGGNIPFNISKLHQFYELDLSNNNFAGPFPRAVLGATQQTFLDIRYNQFTGPIPSEVFKLDLDVLFLNNNQFSGNIPDNIGQTPVLFLTLANNQFTGPIPKSIGQTAINLLEVLFLNNKLSGCLPYEIGLLNQTRIFDASINKLTGPIPHSFGCLEDMRTMNFSYNQLYGAVPESLCALDEEHLTTLDLKFNYLTQVGDECRDLIEKKILNVDMNCILGLPRQRSAEECTAFFSIDRNCPDPKSFSYVPCHIPPSSERKQEASHRVRKTDGAPSPAYAALHQNHD